MSEQPTSSPPARRHRSPALARGTTQDAVRRHNLAALLRHVHSHGPTSRAELTRVLQLNRSTIAALVEDLVARGLVEEHGATGRRAPGRPSNVVRMRADRLAVLAVVLGVDAVVTAAVAPGGQVIHDSQVSLDDESSRAFERVLTTVGQQAKTIAGRLPAGVEIVGMGAAVPGVVRRQDGLVHQAPNLGWNDVPLGARLASRLRRRLGVELPVACRNDASLGALAEHTRGAAMGSPICCMCTARSGSAEGSWPTATSSKAPTATAGEVGHMRVNPEAGVPVRILGMLGDRDRRGRPGDLGRSVPGWAGPWSRRS